MIQRRYLKETQSDHHTSGQWYRDGISKRQSDHHVVPLHLCLLLCQLLTLHLQTTSNQTHLSVQWPPVLHNANTLYQYLHHNHHHYYYYYKRWCLKWYYHTQTLQGHLTNTKTVTCWRWCCSGISILAKGCPGQNSVLNHNHHQRNCTNWFNFSQLFNKLKFLFNAIPKMPQVQALMPTVLYTVRVINALDIYMSMLRQQYKLTKNDRESLICVPSSIIINCSSNNSRFTGACPSKNTMMEVHSIKKCSIFVQTCRRTLTGWLLKPILPNLKNSSTRKQLHVFSTLHIAIHFNLLLVHTPCKMCDVCYST